ncbi:MAG TPA: penicillin-binding protein 1C [Thermoanaerobaculia bacterium]
MRNRVDESTSRREESDATPRRLVGAKTRRLLLAFAALLVAFAAWVRFTPVAPELLDRTKHASVTITDRHGEVLYESLAASGARAEWLTANNLPAHVVAATLAAEDRRFQWHLGVDPIAIARAMVHNVKALRVVEGGSTITQQVAKLLLQSRSRSLQEKAREAVLAARLEHRYTKKEILALYLNLAPYGNRIHGVARASRAYFGCAPAQLTPAQAAFLASLPQRPSAFNPLRDPNAARARQQRILARMNLPAEELQRARREELRFTSSAQPVLAMHFVERFGYAARVSARPIRTTLDAKLQRTILGIISAQRASLLEHGARSVAVAVLDNKTGEWLAWEGSGDYFGDPTTGSGFGGAFDGVVTPRQPGSTLKPFTYALAFESGRSPATVLADVPSHFPTGEDGVVYTPRNYDGRYRGPLRARAALAGSENVPAVALLHQIGSESFLRLLRNAGFTGLDRTAEYYGLGLTLGNAEVTLEQLIRAYATFARGGVPVGGREQLVSKRTAFWITDILSDPDAREYAFGSGGSLDFPFPVAVKTGTSQAYRDNWTVGYTKDVTVGVWVGNFDRQPLHGSSGVTGAAPIFNAAMLAAVKHVRGALPIGDTTPIVEPPPDVEEIQICALSGARPSTYCPALRKEWLATSEPARFCSWHHDGAIDWPAEYRAWVRATQPTPPPQSTRHASVFRIANPPNGATYLIDPTLRTQYQTLRLRADAASRVQWRVNDRVVGTEWPLVPGEHVITAVDDRGRRDSVKIVVK